MICIVRQIVFQVMDMVVFRLSYSTAFVKVVADQLFLDLSMVTSDTQSYRYLINIVRKQS